MNKNANDQYQMSSEREESLWSEATIVFDSSALLDLYFLPESTREKVSNEIFEKLPGRLWIPAHVQFEYLKNREKVIKKPISEKYQPLIKKIKKISSSASSDILKRVEEVIRDTIKDNSHPYLNQEHINDFKKKADTFISYANNFEKNILNEIKRVEKQILNVKNNDDVLESLESFFKVGRDFSFDEILEITKEGKHRYEFRIPPGYGDFYNNEKKGIQIFGDLIIWKQILEFSKESKKPVIFITNDITKDKDWCYIDNKATELRIYSPREELIKEIKDYSSVDFWMYNLPQFLYYANHYLKSTIQEEVIQNISQFINTQNLKGNCLSFECNSCGKIHKYNESEFDLEFDHVSSSKRNMGIENQYQTQEHFECDCGNNITTTFELWEYPEGIHNYDSLKIDSAKLLESFDFTINFYDDELDSCRCHICSENRHEIGNGVHFLYAQEFVNEYDSTHLHHRFSSVLYGNCEACGELHIKCALCSSVTLLMQYYGEEVVECEGGCGLKYSLDTTESFEGIGSYKIRLIDHRKEMCTICGEDFLNVNETKICYDCEIN